MARRWAVAGRDVWSPACRLMGGAMYWLMLLAGIAAPAMASAQSRFQALDPDYTQGYERPDSERTDWPWTAPGLRPLPDETRAEPIRPEAPRFGRPPATEAGTTSEYRFRGDPPPSAGGTQAVDPDSDLRFRPLTPRERERLGPTTRWRPTDEERHGEPTERSTLFDTLVPDGPPSPGPWSRPR